MFRSPDQIAVALEGYGGGGEHSDVFVDPEDPPDRPASPLPGSHAEHIATYLHSNPERIFRVISFGSEEKLQPALPVDARSRLANWISADWQDPIDFSYVPSPPEHQAARQERVAEKFNVWKDFFAAVAPANLPPILWGLRQERMRYRYTIPRPDMSKHLFDIMLGLSPLDGTSGHKPDPADFIRLPLLRLQKPPDADNFVNHLLLPQHEELEKLQHMAFYAGCRVSI